eukprot:scaffold43296_cov2657-Skeletonema_marinoi.AAC.1
MLEVRGDSNNNVLRHLLQLLLRLGVTLDESQGGEREYMTINQMFGCTASDRRYWSYKAISGVLESC